MKKPSPAIPILPEISVFAWVFSNRLLAIRLLFLGLWLGTGFTGATAVTFGSTAAAGFTVNGDTSITTISPAADAGTVDITVTTAGGTSATNANDQFSFVAAPVVSDLSPDSGSVDGGTWVTITGANFTRATGVMFGDAPAGFTVDSDTAITAYSPPGETPDTVDVTVTSPGGTSATGSADVFTCTPPDLPHPPFSAYFTNVLERCKFRPASTNCTVRGRLIIRNTGTSTLPAMRILVFSGMDGGFDPMTDQLVRTFRTKPIRPGQGGLPSKPKKLNLKARARQNLTGVFLFATDANTNLLTSTVIPSRRM